MWGTVIAADSGLQALCLFVRKFKKLHECENCVNREGCAFCSGFCNEEKKRKSYSEGH